MVEYKFDTQLLIEGQNLDEDAINEYYNKFLKDSNQSMLTYLLYGLYYLNFCSSKYNYNDLLVFIRNNREELLENELYMKILCLCYRRLESNRFLDKKETLELMDDNFRKVAITNLKINIEFKELTEDEIQNIIDSNRIIENIDSVIWYLTSRRN